MVTHERELHKTILNAIRLKPLKGNVKPGIIAQSRMFKTKNQKKKNPKNLSDQWFCQVKLK